MKYSETPHVGATDTSRLSAANDDDIGLIVEPERIRLRDLPTVRMTLEGVAKSDEAKGFVQRLQAPLSRDAAGRGTRGLPKASAAILFDVLRAASRSPVKPLLRPMSNASFKGQRIGYWNARAALEAFERCGLLRRAGGNIDRTEDGSQGTLTRFFPSPELIEELANHGITPANRTTHFRRIPNASFDLPPIILNTAKVRRGNRMPAGKSLPVDYSDPVVALMAEKVRRISSFTAQAEFGNMEFEGLQLVFNMGDQPEVHYNKGGRLWDLSGRYQFLTAEERKLIRINGEQSVEVDIGSSHLTIFLSLLNIPFDPTIDLYAIDGFDREVIKRYVNLMLSEPRIPRRWPSSIRKKFRKKCKKEIDKDHTIEQVIEASIAKYPILKDRTKIPITWADLQFLEGQAILDAIYTLNQIHNVVALPVHDSLIVQEKNREVSSSCLRQAFYGHVGVYPKIK